MNPVYKKKKPNRLITHKQEDGTCRPEDRPFTYEQLDRAGPPGPMYLIFMLLSFTS